MRGNQRSAAWKSAISLKSVDLRNEKSPPQAFRSQTPPGSKVVADALDLKLRNDLANATLNTRADSR
jgi:hypothetical protein